MGNYLDAPITQKESISGSDSRMRYGCSEMQGWRTGMEDAHSVILDLGKLGKEPCEGLSFFGVFDGHGGREVATFSGKHAPDVFARQIAERRAKSSNASVDSGMVGDALVNTFHHLDDMLRAAEFEEELRSYKENSMNQTDRMAKVLKGSIAEDMQKAETQGSLTRDEAFQVMRKHAILRKLEEGGHAGLVDDERPAGSAANFVGCTAVCIGLNDKFITCGNAGDSRAILCRKGRVVELSFDHKPNDPKERERIEAAGGHITSMTVGERTVHRVNGNLNLSRSVGDLEYKKMSNLPPEKQIICATPDIVSVPRQADDEFIVLACDGIWDVKTNEQVCTFVRQRLQRADAELTRIAEDLLDACITPDPKTTNGLGADNMTCIIVEFHGRVPKVDSRESPRIESTDMRTGEPKVGVASTGLGGGFFGCPCGAWK